MASRPFGSRREGPTHQPTRAYKESGLAEVSARALPPTTECRRDVRLAPIAFRRRSRPLLRSDHHDGRTIVSVAYRPANHASRNALCNRKGPARPAKPFWATRGTLLNDSMRRRKDILSAKSHDEPPVVMEGVTPSERFPAPGPDHPCLGRAARIRRTAGRLPLMARRSRGEPARTALCPCSSGAPSSPRIVMPLSTHVR